MSEGLTYKLVVVLGPRKGQTFVLENEDQVIGRGDGCTIRFAEDPLISREHLRLHLTEGELMAEDLGSTHGSLLNGKALRGGATVVVGDQLQVSASTLKVALAAEGEQSSDVGFEQSAAVPAEANIDSTDHLHPDDSPKTQVHIGFGATVANDEDGDVKSYESQETRMLKPEELAGLRSASSKPKRSVSKTPLLGLAIIGLFVLGLLVFFNMPKEEGNNATLLGQREVRDEQFRTEVQVPYSWQREDGVLPVVADFRILTEEGQEVGAFIWQATRSRAYEITGLVKGFEQLESELEARHPGYQRVKIKNAKYNDIDVIEYYFTADQRKGHGLFFFHKDTRTWLEGDATVSMYAKFSGVITEALQSVDLDGKHIYLKYPAPSLEVKRMALQDPDSVVAEAQYLLRQAKELIGRRSMRPENLYRSTELLRLCMQNCEALTSYPDFRDEAARKLVEAKSLHAKDVKKQRALVLGAMKIKDYNTARIECYHLMQMVPDKQAKYYKDAEKLFKKLQKSK